MTTLAQIAQVLRTTEKNVVARIIGLGLSRACSRCGGTRCYSFDGTSSRCYGCSGRGYHVPKTQEYPAVLEAAKVAAADGRLDAYLERIAMQRRTKSASDQVFAAWKTVSAINPYRWQDAVGALPGSPIRTRADLNHRCHEAAETVFRAINRRADLPELDRLLAAALQEIAQVRAEVEAFNASQG